MLNHWLKAKSFRKQSGKTELVYTAEKRLKNFETDSPKPKNLMGLLLQQVTK